jgi:hypothetical protein
MTAKPMAVPGWGLCLLLLAGPAAAEIGTIDAVPAATLLLPYFEVDLGDPSGTTTLFSINNASAAAAVAHVTMWTDESIPTLDFDVYLTGYDVQTINIRDIFNGNLPRTADAGNDPSDTISSKGSLSQDTNFPGATGPCAQPYPVSSALNATLVDHIRKSHTGQFSAVYSGCSGANYGDDIARGYMTIDSVVSCNLSFPSDAGYFTTLADNRNILWGDFAFVSPAERSAAGDTLVHIEACSTPSVGNGAGQCPFSFAAGDYTFYGRYNSVAGQDQREPLGSLFAARYIQGGAFSARTDLIVWRDSKTRPVGANGTHSCSSKPGWFPLNQSDVVAFDEEENPTDLCFQGDNVSPPTGGGKTCFPLEAQSVHLAGGNVFASDPTPPSGFGWLYLNLDHTLASGDPYPGRAQAWVAALTSTSTSLTVEKIPKGIKVIHTCTALNNHATTTSGGVLIPP